MAKRKVGAAADRPPDRAMKRKRRAIIMPRNPDMVGFNFYLAQLQTGGLS